MQWQVSTNHGGTFTNIPGATSTTLSFITNVGENGDLYRAVFTNSQGHATTLAATLTVTAAPQITLNPVSQTIVAGHGVTFTAAATGTPAPTVQWQVSTNHGGTFVNIPGANSTTYSFTTSTGQTGNQYRAVFTNSTGSPATLAATLTVTAVPVAPVIVTNPVSQTIVAGHGVTFTASATGTPAPVQWQVSTNHGGTFVNIPGATSTPLSFTTSVGENGDQYRAVFTNSAGHPNTSAATLTVTAAPVVTINPLSQTIAAGHMVTFSAAASGQSRATVQWQVSTNNGGTFVNIPGIPQRVTASPLPPGKTATCIVPCLPTRRGTRPRRTPSSRSVSPRGLRPSWRQAKWYRNSI